MSVLFVLDNNELDQRIIKLNLVRFPVFKHALYFYEGVKLIKYLKENKDDRSNLPDVILFDLNMPEFNGWNVLDALQILYPSLCKKPLVYMVSASSMSKNINRSLAYHFIKDFIPKPVTGDILLLISNVNRFENQSIPGI
ncbi:MAG: response regulator [Mucilaginibacter sp.]|jgi:CheY-like chemotaxis protein|nr:response regulator [Mucilaginibacter sp.]MDB5138778.1 response regulator [Mucilaginibacter sp.]